MSATTAVSSSAHPFNTHPGMLSGPVTFLGFILESVKCVLVVYYQGWLVRLIQGGVGSLWVCC